MYHLQKSMKNGMKVKIFRHYNQVPKDSTILVVNCVSMFRSKINKYLLKKIITVGNDHIINPSYDSAVFSSLSL